MAKQFASAGNAAEQSEMNAENPVGLYRHPDGFEVGVIDPVQGDAVIRQGFTLVEEGRDAAMSAGSSKEAKAAEERNLPKTMEETSPGQAPDASDVAQEAVRRVPDENIEAPVVPGTAAPDTLSKEEHKEAQNIKDELSKKASK